MKTLRTPASHLYGRRKGRPLRVRKASLLDTLLPSLKITLPVQGFLDPASLFHQKPSQLWLEIGFGGGEHLAAQAARHPDIGMIGCEPFINGVASLMDHLDKECVKNVRVHPEDARPLMDALPDACLDRIYVLYSDPWPKARHAERRFIGPHSLPRLARVLKPKAQLVMATDHTILADHIREHMPSAPEFMCDYQSEQPPEGWIPTRYEQKGIAAGRVPVYFIYRRLP